MATPLLMILQREGFVVDVLIDGDYAETADLLRDWSGIRSVVNGRLGDRPLGTHDLLVPAIPPFYWHRYAARYRNDTRCIARPDDALFYADEQRYYIEFARRLDCDVERPPHYFLPIVPDVSRSVGARTLALAPGCKTGEMAAKRWPFFAELAARFDDVAVFGTRDDLVRFDGLPFSFPARVRDFVGTLTLRETARVMAAAGVVVANDSGLGHVAGAVGVPTLMLFGPTPDHTLGTLPPNVTVIRAGLRCEPCWFGRRFGACSGAIDCLRTLSVERVAAAVQALLEPALAGQ